MLVFGTGNALQGVLCSAFGGGEIGHSSMDRGQHDGTHAFSQVWAAERRNTLHHVCYVDDFSLGLRLQSV